MKFNWQNCKRMVEFKQIICKLASSHILRSCDKAFFLVVLFCSKKKSVFLFYIYNFYFENLIYKWIKKFENLQESGLIF